MEYLCESVMIYSLSAGSFVSGFDGREQGADHSHQPQGDYNGTTVRPVRPCVARVVWRYPGRVLPSLRLLHGQFNESYDSILAVFWRVCAPLTVMGNTQPKTETDTDTNKKEFQ